MRFDDFKNLIIISKILLSYDDYDDDNDDNYKSLKMIG